MKAIKRFIFFIALALCTHAFADTEVSVCQLGAEGTSDVFLLPCETYTSQQSCTNGAWVHWSLVSDADKAKFSNAQAALVSGKNVVIRAQGCSAGYDHVYMLRLKK